MKIGVMLDSFRTDFLTAVKYAASLKIRGVQAYAEKLFGQNYDKAKIREIKKVLSGEGIECSALCGDFGYKMFYYPQNNRELIEREKAVLEAAVELGSGIVTTHIGVVPETKDGLYNTMLDVCGELKNSAISLGGKFAVETGPEPSYRLKTFLDDVGGGIAVNLDPANLVMCAGDDPVKAVENLKDYIVHTHAKDGIMLKKMDTRQLYTPEEFGKGADCEAYREVPLGTGGVNFPSYLAALKKIGFDGYLTIEREVGKDPYSDIKLAADFLRQKANEGGITIE